MRRAVCQRQLHEILVSEGGSAVGAHSTPQTPNWAHVCVHQPPPHQLGSLGSSQRSTDPLAGGEVVVVPS